MPGSANIYIDTGDSPSIVTQQTNTTGVETPILEVDPQNGTFLRLLNRVAKGDEQGVPIYADLKDSNSNDLPVDSTIKIELVPAGASDARTVSEEFKSISVFNTLTLSEQRNQDNVDSVKMVLQRDGRVLDNVDFRDVDTLRIVMDSSTQIDWSNSALYIDSSAVRGPFDKGA